MLDTNMVSYIIKGTPPQARHRLSALPVESIVVSVVTQAELFYGLARKGYPAIFSKLVHEFLLRVQVLTWNELCASTYGDLRTSCVTCGVTLSSLDLMIAAHAVTTQSILVTHDKVFGLIPGDVLTVEDWI
jgi:tRNA(fMet)-specific endonuclease VapC